MLHVRRSPVLAAGSFRLAGGISHALRRVAAIYPEAHDGKHRGFAMQQRPVRDTVSLLCVERVGEMMLVQDSEWRERWEERCTAVRTEFGDTLPEGRVMPFSWEGLMLPGACGMCFARHDHFLYMTLGLTQPGLYMGELMTS